MEDGRKYGILFGSGISVPEEYPKTGEISEHIKSGANVIYDNKIERFRIKNGTIVKSPEIEFIKNALAVLAPNQKTSYEEIFTNIDVLARDSFRENSIYYRIANMYLEIINSLATSVEKSELLSLPLGYNYLDYLLDYIFDIVESMILNAEKRHNEKRNKMKESYYRNHYLAPFFEPLNENVSDRNRFEGLDIFTLNHDLLLEKYLTDNKIDYEDGFIPLDDNVDFQKWSPQIFTEPCAKRVRLFKLHGSINWYWLYTCRTLTNKNGIITRGASFPFLARFSNIDDVDHYRDPKYELEEEHFELRYDRPSILIGHYMKNFEYTSMPYLQMIECFSNFLQNNDRLVICGYGWRDLGINKLLEKWPQHLEKPTRILHINKNKKWRESAEIDLNSGFDITDITDCDVEKIEKRRLTRDLWSFLLS